MHQRRAEPSGEDAGGAVIPAGRNRPASSAGGQHRAEARRSRRITGGKARHERSESTASGAVVGLPIKKQILPQYHLQEVILAAP
jgi:hypothetical protein